MNLYEHTIIARQDIPSEIKQHWKIYQISWEKWQENS